MQVMEPLPKIPEWMEIKPKQSDHPIRTLPAEHHFGRPGKTYGFPRELVSAARSVINGEVSQRATEIQFADILAMWSESTTSSSE